jgi:hypothetical protein
MIIRQVATRTVSIERIMGDAMFERGLHEIRNGKPFDWRIDAWEYERGRLFGCIAPLGMKLFIASKKLNPQAVSLFRVASDRGYIL